MSVTLLRRLVQIPSPNPPGDTRAIADFVAERMRAAGCAVRQLAPEAKPEALNTIAEIGTGEPRIMLHAHIDTVPIAATEAEKWSVDPYAGEVREGALFGKGSIDDKAPLASMMLAMMDAARQETLGRHARPGGGGRKKKSAVSWAPSGWLMRATCPLATSSSWASRRPTKSPSRIRASCARQSAPPAYRSTRPTPTAASTPSWRCPKSSARWWIIIASSPNRVHPVIGSPTCNIGVIEGGSTANAVPDACAIYLDRRMIPA